MATRDPESKKQQLLDAALAEFAAHGIAGARVDKIAKSAGVSAGLVYTYFGSKEELFDAVFDTIVSTTLATTPITTDDLPEYAAKLFDGYEENPHIQRLSTWHRLEHDTASTPHVASLQSMVDKRAALEAALDAGTLSTRFTAVELLGLILALSGMWANGTHEFLELVKGHSRAQRRQTVKNAVAALIQ
jgi:AcrR family transcriptional regulator